MANNHVMWKRMASWALLGALPGLVLLGLSIPIEPEIDLLVGLAGISLTVVGAVIGALASREPDSSRARRLILRSSIGALVGLGFFVVQPVVGTIAALVGIAVGANWDRLAGHGTPQAGA